MRDKSKPHVGIAFHPPAHYRSSLVERLDSDARLSIEFMFDPLRSRQPIKHIDPEVVQSFRPLKFRMLFGIVWQSGLIVNIVRRKYDAVVLTGDVHDISTWVVLFLGRLMKVPVLLWTQGWRKPETGMVRFVRLSFYRLSTRLLVYGERARQIGIGLGFPEDRITVTYNSVNDLSECPEESEESNSLVARSGTEASRSLRILFPSRVKMLKRLDLLFLAAAFLAEEGTAIELVILGDGPDLDEVKRCAAETGVHAVFLGPVYSPSELSRWYRDADCIALPAHAGLAVVQAMQHGRPVVVNDDSVGNGPEAEAVVDGVTGVVYSANSVSGLADALLKASMLGSQPETERVCVAMAHEVWSAKNQAKRITEGVLESLRSDYA